MSEKRKSTNKKIETLEKESERDKERWKRKSAIEAGQRKREKECLRDREREI